jgi:hypothetical protein
MTRLYQLGLIAILGLFVVSCGGGSNLTDTEAPVVLTIEVAEYVPDVDICQSAGVDLTIDSMSVNSTPKSPGTVLGSSADVLINRWVITPVRDDGGTMASPQWTYDLTVLVAAGGSADLSDFRIYPAEFYDLEPLVNLRPENGGVDPETGRRNIRQKLMLQLFGETIAGKRVSTVPIPIAFNFTCLN